VCVCVWYRVRAVRRNHLVAAVTSHGHGARATADDVKLTSYNTADTATDTDYYRTWRWRHDNMAAAGVSCQHGDDVVGGPGAQYVEHIYESPKFDRRHHDSTS